MSTRKPSDYNTFISIPQQMEAELKPANDLKIVEVDGEGIRNVGCWSVQENLLYSIFIDQNKLVMLSKKKRKKTRIFDRMALFIGSRNSLQCRSHHQKLIQKLGQIKQIVNTFRNYFGKECYRQNYKLMANNKGKPRPGFPVLLVKQQQNESEVGGLFSECGLNKDGQIQEEQVLAGVKVEAGEVEGAGLVRETPQIACKAEQQIQYYAPYGYYISNSLPFQLITPFYIHNAP